MISSKGYPSLPPPPHKKPPNILQSTKHVIPFTVNRYSGTAYIKKWWLISSYFLLLFSYLQVEWETKKATVDGERIFDKETFKGSNPKCPQQNNFSDCGIYVLQYVESFFEVCREKQHKISTYLTDTLSVVSINVQECWPAFSEL